jgi:hypothetical protein
MIFTTGFYETRDGRIVEIKKIYQTQPFAEGVLDNQFYGWHTNGRANPFAESPRDIVRFISRERQ